MTETVRYTVDHVAFRDVCQWLRTNNVDPHEIPVKAPIEIMGTGGMWTIHYEVFVRNAQGQRVYSPETLELLSRAAVAPMVVDPPMHWLTLCVTEGAHGRA